MSEKVPLKEQEDRIVRNHPSYVAHIETDGAPKLIEDPGEAYEVAAQTKDQEVFYRDRLAAATRMLDTSVLDGNYSVHDEGEARARHAVQLRIDTDKIAARVSEAYKNGAEFLDLSSEEFTKALAEAPIYRKAAKVKARKATPGEVVVTVTPDGVEEGRNTAGEDDHVVTGANGADFILPGEKFNKLYEETEEGGVFQSRGMARIIDNPTGKKIGILAPWGEMQYGDAESKIAVQYDSENPDVVGTDRYILDKTEFEAYKPVEKADA